jgi:hypothetical protein
LDIEYIVNVVLIPIFADRSSPQSSFDYYKILISDDNKVLKKRINIFHKDIDSCVNDLYNDFIKISYEWPIKELVGCKKNEKDIDIVYTVKMPYFKNINKIGKVINIQEFTSLITDEYYNEIISRTFS